MEGQPRRVSEYAPHLHTINVWVSVSAFVLGFSMVPFAYNMYKSYRFGEIVTADDLLQRMPART